MEITSLVNEIERIKSEIHYLNSTLSGLEDDLCDLIQQVNRDNSPVCAASNQRPIIEVL